MENDKEKKPTDEGLKNYNPSNRDFERTQKQTDRVSSSEIEEQHREKENSDNS